MFGQCSDAVCAYFVSLHLDSSSFMCNGIFMYGISHELFRLSSILLRTPSNPTILSLQRLYVVISDFFCFKQRFPVHLSKKLGGNRFAPKFSCGPN